MKFKSIQKAAVAAVVVIGGGAAHAESYVTKEDRTFKTSRALVTGCLKSIERHHGKSAQLFLNRTGQLIRSGDEMTYLLRGWVWQDGERTPVLHDCSARAQGGITVTLSYGEEQIAKAEIDKGSAS